MKSHSTQISLTTLLVIFLATAAATAKPPAAGVEFEPGVISASSVEPETSDARARALARKNAGEELLWRVRDVARGMGYTPSDESLRQIIAAEIAGGGIVLDEAVTRVEKSYGEIYYATVKVDATVKPMKRMADRAVAVARKASAAEWRRVAVRGGGVAAVLSLVTLLYLAANALTRGYYQGRLRFAAVSVIGLSAAATMWLV